MALKSLALMFLLAAFFAEGVAWSRSSDMKNPCANCHTMHNSQGGLVPEISTPSYREGGSGMPQGALLSTSCYGCHSDAIFHVDTPVVLHFSPPNYGLTGTELNDHNTLAGGDFYWVANGNDLKGHNVEGFSMQSYRTPPGGTLAIASLTCAGITGCHGYLNRTGDIPAMYRTHHSAESADPRLRDGNMLTTSYRWLNGIAGYEDTDYELTVDSADHNQYKGFDRLAEGDITSTSSSISNFCARCHGNFHTGVNPWGISDDAASFGSDPWIRHPVDYAMPLTGEYAAYGYPAVSDYNFVTPVGSVDVSAKKPTVTGLGGDTIITCVTCHRAHGSPYDYSLRWNYKNWPDAGYNGCGDCHTAKN